jgi:hypothetical protein
MKKRFDLASKLTHRILYIILGIMILGAIIVGVRATTTTGLVPPVNPGHNSSQVFIPVGNGNYITLQNAIDYGYLLQQNTSTIQMSLLPVSSPYELASQVLITFKGKVMTLQQAISTNVFINNALQVGYSYTSTLPIGGDYGSNTNINTTSGNMTLQNAINGGLTLLSSACLSGFWCPQGQKVGNPCYPVQYNGLCMNWGTITTSATCTGYSFANPGTSCSTDGSLTCDGKGQCEGWSGYGCTGSTGCRFGVSSSNGYYCCNANPSENVPVLEYCAQDYSCHCPTSGSCSTCTNYYSWTTKPVASGNFGPCASPPAPSSNSGSAGHGGQPTSPSDTSSTSGDSGDSPGDGTGGGFGAPDGAV